MRHIPQIVSAIVGLALVITGAVLLARGEYERGAGLIAGGLGTLALPRVRLPRRGAKPAIAHRDLKPESVILEGPGEPGEPDCEPGAHQPGCRLYVPPTDPPPGGAS